MCSFLRGKDKIMCSFCAAPVEMEQLELTAAGSPLTA